MPTAFDAPLDAHHKIVGRWAARDLPTLGLTRPEARAQIERRFAAAVDDVLGAFEMVDLSVAVLLGPDDLPPAIAITCDTVGQIDLGWIEADNVLTQTLFRKIAPLGWRAAAYKVLCETLDAALPIFGYDVLFEEIAAYWWEGETDDESARRFMVDMQGGDIADLDVDMLPSAMNARRPEWMNFANADPLKHLPKPLRAAIGRVRDTHKRLRALDSNNNAWRYETDLIDTYLPGFDDASHLPPLTLVPFEQFARELDDIARFGMEQGFLDTTGLYQLPDVAALDGWFASFRLGADFLLAAQALIALDPANAR